MTADDVAHAIIAACRETGADPLQVGAGLGGKDKSMWPITRARVFASHALAELFPRHSRAAIAECCGVGRGRSANYFAECRSNRRAGGSSWFSDLALARVMAHVREHSTRPIPIEPTTDEKKQIRALQEKPQQPEKSSTSKPSAAAAFVAKRTSSPAKPPDSSTPAPRPASPPPAVLETKSRAAPPRRPDSMTGVFTSAKNGEPSEKRSLREMLAEAAANTAKLPIKD